MEEQRLMLGELSHVAGARLKHLWDPFPQDQTEA